tara:strand:+ start:990 stop:1973 length:984 start_codon:yes stop_codon:yes gene_type:complete
MSKTEWDEHLYDTCYGPWSLFNCLDVDMILLAKGVHYSAFHGCNAQENVDVMNTLGKQIVQKVAYMCHMANDTWCATGVSDENSFRLTTSIDIPQHFYYDHPEIDFDGKKEYVDELLSYRVAYRVQIISRLVKMVRRGYEIRGLVGFEIFEAAEHTHCLDKRCFISNEIISKENLHGEQTVCIRHAGQISIIEHWIRSYSSLPHGNPAILNLRDGFFNLIENVSPTSEALVGFNRRTILERSAEERSKQRLLIGRLEFELARKEHELSNLQKEREPCAICLVSARDTAIYPCGHRHFCGPCAQDLQRLQRPCAICKRRIEGIFRIFQ